MTDTQLARMPIGTESHTATLKSGLSMRWFEKGEGRPVILLHGFPELAVSWKAQFATLADHYRVIAPDLRGYGYTDAPKKVSAYHLSTLVQDVVELADALHIEDFHLAGHDWGGTIAWEAAMEHPKRIRSVAVLNSIPPRLLIREMCRPDQLMRSWYMFFFQIPFLPESRLCADPESTVPAMFRKVAAKKEVFTRDSLVPYIEQFRDRGLAGLHYYRASSRRPPPALRPVTIPAKLIWGLEDKALGPRLADKAKYTSWVPQVEICLVPGSGHWVQQEAPDEVNALLLEHWQSVDA